MTAVKYLQVTKDRLKYFNDPECNLKKVYKGVTLKAEDLFGLYFYTGAWR